jgi:hypothetical protein
MGPQAAPNPGPAEPALISGSIPLCAPPVIDRRRRATVLEGSIRSIAREGAAMPGSGLLAFQEPRGAFTKAAMSAITSSAT